MFGHRSIYGWAPLRTGYCRSCNNNIHDKSAKKTNLHHEFYITCMPWVGITELCISCHGKQHKGRALSKRIFYNADAKMVRHPVIIF
jgi:hypothetical protein